MAEVIEGQIYQRETVYVPKVKIPKITQSGTYLQLELRTLKGRMKAKDLIIANLEWEVKMKEEIIDGLVEEYFMMKNYYEGEEEM